MVVVKVVVCGDCERGGVWWCVVVVKVWCSGSEVAGAMIMEVTVCGDGVW